MEAQRTAGVIIPVTINSRTSISIRLTMGLTPQPGISQCLLPLPPTARLAAGAEKSNIILKRNHGDAES